MGCEIYAGYWITSPDYFPVPRSCMQHTYTRMLARVPAKSLNTTPSTLALSLRIEPTTVSVLITHLPPCLLGMFASCEPENPPGHFSVALGSCLHLPGGMSLSVVLCAVNPPFGSARQPPTFLLATLCTASAQAHQALNTLAHPTFQPQTVLFGNTQFTSVLWLSGFGRFDQSNTHKSAKFACRLMKPGI